MSETSLLPREKRVDGELVTSIDKSLEDLKGDTHQRDGSITLWIPWGIIWLKDCDNLCSSQILGILRLRKQEDRNSHDQDFISEPAWNINFGQMESGPVAFPSFLCWRGDMKSSERLRLSGVQILQRLDTSEATD